MSPYWLRLLLFRFRWFRACRLPLPLHTHVHELCPLDPSEWEDMRRRPSTYRLWYKYMRQP